MSGETDLSKLLAGMQPVLDPETYVFATTQEPDVFAHLPAIMRFRESEGETLILAAPDAESLNLQTSGLYARITLSVHSALDAVGFLAAVCSALAKEGISTNAVAGYYHDHIFVPQPRADDAMVILQDLSANAKC